MTALSLFIAVAGFGAGFTIATVKPGTAGHATGGSVCGAAIAVMHFTGVSAMRLPAQMSWDMGLVMLAVIIAVVGTSAALTAAKDLTRPSHWLLGAGFMTLSICGLHFIAMAAVNLTPTMMQIDQGLYGRNQIAMAVGIVTLLILIGGIGMLGIDRFANATTVKELQVILGCAPSAIALFDADQKLSVWNQLLEDLLAKYGLEAVRGLTFREVVTAAAAAGSETATARLAAPRLLGVSLSAETFLTPDGRYMQGESAPVPEGGVVIVLTDITDQLMLNEREAEARRRAEAASQAKSDFLANMSHEIRTPLNAVLGMAHVMGREPLPDLQRNRLDVINEAGQVLLSVLDNVLDLSKIEAGKLELEAREFDLERKITVSTAAYAKLAARKGVAFHVEIAPEARGLWRGDAVRLRQVLSNLVSNALKFTATGAITVRVAPASEGLAFEVADTGIGVPAEQMDSIFEKFTQADTSATRRFGGTGLGLAICRQLVNLMGGELKVTSVEGEGSTFSFSLPLQAVHREAELEGIKTAPAPTSAAADQEQSLHILAAEDNPTNQMILKAMLGPLGVDLTVVENGAEAVRAYIAHPYDLILMDIQMPEMNGVEATREIRRHEEATSVRRTPIIAVTANVMNQQIEEYRRAGMDDCVAKPLDMTVLAQAIESALTRGAAAIPA